MLLPSVAGTRLALSRLELVTGRFVSASRAEGTLSPLCRPHQGATVKTRQEDGFTLVELLIVVAIIGIIASIGVAQVMRARLAANESSAISSMRTINTAQVSYANSAANGGFATSLLVLATTCPGGTSFISPDLDPSLPSATTVGATGMLKSGYVVDLGAVGVGATTDCNGTPATTDYVATAVPRTIGATGERGFNTNGAGTIYFDPAGLPTGTTPIQ
jgi:type IV pilus assembly protein PilA